jgi:hypothetical protein
VAERSGAPGDQGSVQEVSASRHGDASGAETDAQQDWNEEGHGSSYAI